MQHKSSSFSSFLSTLANSPLASAGVGAGIGGLTGALSSKNNRGRNALLGAATGGALGYGGSKLLGNSKPTISLPVPAPTLTPSKLKVGPTDFMTPVDGLVESATNRLNEKNRYLQDYANKSFEGLGKELNQSGNHIDYANPTALGEVGRYATITGGTGSLANWVSGGKLMPKPVARVFNPLFRAGASLEGAEVGARAADSLGVDGVGKKAIQAAYMTAPLVPGPVGNVASAANSLSNLFYSAAQKQQKLQAGLDTVNFNTINGFMNALKESKARGDDLPIQGWLEQVEARGGAPALIKFLDEHPALSVVRDKITNLLDERGVAYTTPPSRAATLLKALSTNPVL